MKPAASRLLHALAIAVFATMVLLAPSTASAQEARGTISGKVRDASDAVMPGVSVRITDAARGTTVNATTNDAGLYQAPYLLPGTYQIVVEVNGFKKYVRGGIALRIGDNLDIPVQLEVGQTSETVTVTAETPTLDTTSGSMGQTVDSRRVAELPLVHGDPYTMIGLSPGVTFARDQRLDRPFEPTHIVGFTVAGTRANRSDLTIDGAPSTATANANEVIASYVPPTDIIQEFKVQTATYDAQFGNTEGGVTSISIKSGTNTLHGTGYFIGEPGSLAANDFFGNLRGQPRPSTHSNRPGATLTGPVYLPKLYNGRDKTFFTFGYEGIRDSRPRFDSTTPTVPTVAMRNGDFSAFLGLTNGQQYQIYNPYSRRIDTAPGRAGHFIQDPFKCDPAGNPIRPEANGTQIGGTACNKIPTQLINPVSNALLQFFPNPRPGGTAEFLNNNSDSTLAEKTFQYDNYTFRVDHALSDRHRLFARASLYRRDSFYNDYFHSIATGTSFQFISRQGVIDDVYTFNSTTVLNVRYGYNRFIRAQDMNPGGQGLDLTTLGLPASFNNAIDPSLRRFPRLDFPGGTYQGTGQTNEVRPIDTHSIAATLNKTLSSHSVKGGMEFRSYRENARFASNNQSGQFVFDNTYTRQKDDSTTTQVALSFASFLLGIPNSTSQVVRAADYAEQSTAWGFFVHDDWRFNSRLTLNLGLRYEVEGALTERYNRSVTGFDPLFAQPFQSTVQANYAKLNDAALKGDVPQVNVLGGLLFAGVNGQSRGLYQTPKKNFMPRLGLAFKLNDKTVIRGGYGIFFGFLGQRRGDVVQTGYSISTNFVPTTDGATITGTLSNPFPNGLLTPPGSSQGLQTNVGNAISFFNQRPLSPYNQRWELGVQRELPAGFVVEASYVGNRGTHIEITRDINAVPNRFLSTLPFLDTARRTYLTGQVDNPFFNISLPGGGTIPGVGSTAKIQRQNLLKPFPQFGTILTTNNDGYSWYHSAQLRIEKRFSKGYTVQASYTHSRFMQATEYLNQGDPLPTEVVSDADYPNRFAMSAIYELPFGKGRQFLSGSNGVVSRIVGGWQVQGVYTYQSGAPLAFNVVTNNTATPGYIYNGNFKDLVIPSDQQSLNQWFNNAGFVALRTSTGTVVTNNGQTVWVAFNDPCKNSFNATSCPGTPLANPSGFNRDSAFQLANNVRTFPLRFSFLRVQSNNNVDFSILKNTQIKERFNMQFRAEFTNFFNHPWLSAQGGGSGTGGVITVPANADFGRIANISNQANYARRVQLGLKLVF
jgi:Carboxypeptidase regulatory-like domain/TonB dependent receptor-like, beta-barrel